MSSQQSPTSPVFPWCPAVFNGRKLSSVASCDYPLEPRLQSNYNAVSYEGTSATANWADRGRRKVQWRDLVELWGCSLSLPLSLIHNICSRTRHLMSLQVSHVITVVRTLLVNNIWVIIDSVLLLWWIRWIYHQKRPNPLILSTRPCSLCRFWFFFLRITSGWLSFMESAGQKKFSWALLFFSVRFKEQRSISKSQLRNPLAMKSSSLSLVSLWYLCYTRDGCRI